MTAPSPDDLLEVAIDAARAGGAVLERGLQGAVDVEVKNERTSIVTWVDKAAQDEVVRLITGRFPDHAILAEEGFAGNNEGEITWIVDPLDGTSNYAHGIPLSCTSVAVRDGDGLAAGAIYEPFRGELFTAVRGGGAWLDGGRLQVSTTPTLARAMVCTGIQSDDPVAIAAFTARLERLYSTCRGVRCLGSPALCLAYIAAGRIDAFLERDATYAWDVAAGALMITEAGGRIEDLAGGPLNLGPGVADVLATNGTIHDALAEVVRAEKARS